MPKHRTDFGAKQKSALLTEDGKFRGTTSFCPGLPTAASRTRRKRPCPCAFTGAPVVSLAIRRSKRCSQDVFPAARPSALHRPAALCAGAAIATSSRSLHLMTAFYHIIPHLSRAFFDFYACAQNRCYETWKKPGAIYGAGLCVFVFHTEVQLDFAAKSASAWAESCCIRRISRGS